MPENDGHEESDTDRDLYTFEGTTNVVLIMDDGIFVGVDSRATRIKSGVGYSKGDLAVEEQNKFEQISKDIYVTSCGNAGASISLWKYLQQNFQEQQYNVETAAKDALKYLKRKFDDEKLYSVSLVVGYRDEKTPEAYKVHYKLREPRKVRGKEVIGQGALYLRDTLKRHKGKDAVELVKVALTIAALFHPSTGSYLKVYHVLPTGGHELKWRGLALDSFYNMFEEFEALIEESEDIAGALFLVSTEDYKVSGTHLSAVMRGSNYCTKLVTAVPVGDFGPPTLPSGFFLYVLLFETQEDLETVVDDADLTPMVNVGTEDSFNECFGEFKKLGFESCIYFKGVQKPIMVVEATKANLKLLTQHATRNKEV